MSLHVLLMVYSQGRLRMRSISRLVWENAIRNMNELWEWHYLRANLRLLRRTFESIVEAVLRYLQYRTEHCGLPSPNR